MSRRYRVSCAGEDVLGVLVKGGHFDDPDQAIVAANYPGAVVFDAEASDYDLTPVDPVDDHDAQARLVRKRVLAAAGLPRDHAFAPGFRMARRAGIEGVPEHVRERYRAGQW